MLDIIFSYSFYSLPFKRPSMSSVLMLPQLLTSFPTNPFHYPSLLNPCSLPTWLQGVQHGDLRGLVPFLSLPSHPAHIAAYLFFFFTKTRSMLLCTSSLSWPLCIYGNLFSKVCVAPTQPTFCTELQLFFHYHFLLGLQNYQLYLLSPYLQSFNSDLPAHTIYTHYLL